MDDKLMCERGTLAILPRPFGGLQRHHDVLKFDMRGETFYAVPFFGSVVVYHRSELEQIAGVSFSRVADVVVSTSTLAIIQDSSRRLNRAFGWTRHPVAPEDSAGFMVEVSEMAISGADEVQGDYPRETQLGRSLRVGMTP